MYYLFILEDGEILRSDTFTDEDAYHCEFGTIDVVRIGNDGPHRYHDGEWYPVEFEHGL